MYRSPRHLLARRPGPADLDEQTVERLLSGSLTRDDAPPGYGGVVALLAAASAPPQASELAAERAMVAGFVAVRYGTGASSPSVLRRPSMLSRLVTAKAAVIAVTAAVAIGGMATAATVARTAPGQDGAKTPANITKAREDRGSGVSAPAKADLCRAWAAGKGGDKGGKADAAAFEALVDAAGGEDKVAGFCADATPSTAGGQAGGQGQAGEAGASRGLDGNSEAQAGLCHAWAAGKPGETSQARRERMGAAAFDALAKAAGGEARIAGFCADVGTPAGNRAGITPDRREGGDRGGENPAAPPQTPAADPGRPEQSNGGGSD